MGRVILLYLAAVALVRGQPYYGGNKSPTTIKREISDKVTESYIPTTAISFKDGCFHEGKWYPHGSEINRGYDGKSWCYGAYCNQFGQVVQWDSFRCSTQRTTTVTTTTPTTLPKMPTTIPPNPTPTGCYNNGKWFPPGSQISRGSTYGWCYGMYCDDQGNIVAWDDWSCSTTTIPSTTPYPTTQRPLGCILQGWMYDLGSEISRYDWIGGQKCSGKRCSNDGQIVTWLTFSCQSKTDRLQSTRSGCWFKGHLYHRGMEIFRKQSPGRCFEGACGKNGLAHWKPISCQKERQFLAGQRRMCSHRGHLYSKGSIVHTRSLYKSHGFGWCVGTKCGRSGRIIAFGPSWLPGYC